ncbi:MAG TPA: HEAT repeat domain-containing protein [Acidimicrobiales bacterium]|nr:hypothetical protein [Actinomycetota bacterium]MDP6061782.1 HEAT repeat domain-containing protein [Acidimicrobiales bacterium]MDP6214870.1 HEAT repeat domain-containing protein [Acidimicrobiales bacterium]MDP7208829.1 HEAT repeat domain-containing protein [Acidimicrobiales bacterium]HJL89524.1 HEAT repeat domain-containing protein [Acidimicrobiales bacterium]
MPARHEHTEPPPTAESATRRRQAIRAGHTGDPDEARRHLVDVEPSVRSAAIGALDRLGCMTDAELGASLGDPSPAVRRRALEIVATTAHPSGPTGMVALLSDSDSGVTEMACWAAGERSDVADLTVALLNGIASGHEDALCREAAVASLGSLGHEAGRAVVLAALMDRPPVRRRAVLALASFEGPDVEAALERALRDRDWQVRQAAEDLLGGAER